MGEDHFVLLNLPDLGTTPSFNGSADSITRGNGFSLAQNVALSRAAIQLQQQTSTNMLMFDADGVLHDIVSNPSRYRVVNTIDADITTPACVLGDTATQNSSRFFNDGHPSTAIHAQLAALLAETIKALATVAARGDVTLLAGQDFQRRLIAAINPAQATTSLALSDGGTTADTTADHEAGSWFLALDHTDGDRDAPTAALGCDVALTALRLVRVDRRRWVTRSSRSEGNRVLQ